MARTNDTTVLPAGEPPTDVWGSGFLEDRWIAPLFRIHGPQLVDAAHLHLGCDPRETEDIVQDFRREVLEGKVRLPRGPADAVRSLFRETVDRCARRRLLKAIREEEIEIDRLDGTSTENRAPIPVRTTRSRVAARCE